MKQNRILLGVLAAGLALTGGCSGGNEVVNYEESEKASRSLAFFGNKYEAANVGVIEDILTDYMQANQDISITYESLKGSDYFDALKSREQAGKLDDVFMVNHDTVLEFSANGSLEDLSELVEDIPFSESIRTQMFSADGKVYWVPTTVSAFGMYCNLDLLEAHGQKIPETLGEWEAACDYFVSQGITPIIVNNDISLKTLALAKGFYPLYKEGKQKEVFEKINSGEEKLSTYLAEGFGLAGAFCEKGYIDAPKALETAKTSDDLEEFAKGMSPFMLTGVWAAGRVQGMEPDFTFQVVPYPVLEDGSVLVINPDVRLSVSAKSQETEPAKEFVSYFMKEENIWKFADNQCSFGPLEGEFEPSLEQIQEVVKSYQTGVSVIGSDSGITFPIWDITAEVSKRLLAGEDLETLMEWMDTEAADRQ